MKSLMAQAFLRAHAGMLDTLLWLFKLLCFRSLLGPCVPPGLPELHCSCECRACCVQMWNPAAAQAHAMSKVFLWGRSLSPVCCHCPVGVTCTGTGRGCWVWLQLPHLRGLAASRAALGTGALTCPAQVGQGWPGVLSTALSPPQDTLELSGSGTNRAESSAQSNAQ